MDTRAIPLDQLHFGHEADPPINARQVGREDEIISLARSIAAHGLGQALNVKDIDGTVYVADGNRRLAALRLNASCGLIAADAPVDCRFGDGGDELSLALNIERVPMHEADQYEKFHELHARGLTEQQIAGRFGIEPTRVRRFIALGRLHPVILKAWRADELDRPAEIVKAFTMAPSQKAQKEVFDRLSKNGRLAGHWIREAFGSGNREAGKLLTFVGREAYLAAGGKIVEDLFGDDHALSDFDLIKRLADERIERECKALEGEGWAWVAISDALPGGWNYSWQKVHPKLDPTPEEAAEIKRLEKAAGKTPHWDKTDEQRAAEAEVEKIRAAIEVRSFTDKDKKKSGAAVSIAADGSLQVTYGVMKPSAPKKEKPKAGEPEPERTISNAVMGRLSVQLTAAAKGAIVDHPHTALAALVAGMACSMTYGLPVRVRADGLLKEGREPEGFASVFRRLCAMSDSDLMKAAAHEVSFCLDMQTHNALSPPLADSDNAEFCEALDEGSSLQACLRTSFDAEDYFKSVPRSFTEAAIGEAINPEEARKAEKLKKLDLVKYAVENVPKTGWLPEPLRTSGYTGPGAKIEQRQAA